MLPDGRRLGAHLPLAGGMVKAVERAQAIGASALQIFSDNPTAWRRRSEPPAELADFRRRLDELDVRPLAIHAPYLINVAGADEEMYRRSVDVLAHELKVADLYGARWVNMHVGSHRGAGVDEGIARVAEGVARAFDQVPFRSGAPVLVLENSAGGGFGIGATVEELAAIMDAIAARGVDPERLGFCLDTAHLWGAGYEISEPREVDRVVEGFGALLGLDRLKMVHLNDSKSALGSHMDRHQHLGAGEIGEVGLRAFICHPGLSHVAYYIETPGMDEAYDAINIARAYDIAAGRPLETLPAEALHLRAGSRSRTAPAAETA